MRILLFLCLIAISGCATQDVRVPQLQYEVRALQQEVAEMSKKLEKTNKTATSANVKATSANVKATKTAAKVEDVKRVAEKASDATPEGKAPARVEKKSVIMKPREINHETSFLPE